MSNWIFEFMDIFKELFDDIENLNTVPKFLELRPNVYII